MPNLLKLHEVIAIVLLNKNDRIASLEEISQEISLRGLYFQKKGDGDPPHKSQIKLRTTLIQKAVKPTHIYLNL